MEEKTSAHHKLNEYFATAICGNDILSSCLYVSGISVIFTGVYAPVVLLMVAGVLFLYRKVYTEVVEALPINGGAYNCLLNGTSKTVAALAGMLTFLSYIATAVISAKVAVEYLHAIIPLPIIGTTISLLLVFSLLVIWGIKDSSRVALVIFIVHILTLVSFLILGLLRFLNGNSLFNLNLMVTQGLIMRHGGLLPMLFLGFSASLLGISGFESSANFVEEQQPGVFRKTLRNMWLGVTIFNPLIAVVVINSLTIPGIAAAKDFLIADTAMILAGSVFKTLVVIDAFLVLSGAVMTSYVGVSGLVSRMAADACLPEFFNIRTQRGTYPRIVLGFFLLCSSILLLTYGNLLSLAGVYTLSFLGVMTMFALGNLVLKETRTSLKRTYHAPVFIVLVALLATFAGMLGNIWIDIKNLYYFSIYFFPAFMLVLTMIYLDQILKWAIRATNWLPNLHQFLRRNFADLIEGKFVIFVHHPKRLFPALDYVDKNETGRNITIVHCQDPEHPAGVAAESTEITTLVSHLQKAGAYPHLNISVLYKERPFDPALVDEVSKELGVRKNRILIGSIHHHHPFDYQDFEGVRVIF